MTTWSEKKTVFETRKQQIDADWNTISSKKTDIKNAIENAIQTGAKMTTAQQTNLQNGLRGIFDTIKNYEGLVREMNQFIQENLITGVTTHVNTISTLNTEISSLKDKIEVTKGDYETAISRRQSIEEPRKKLSNYQGFSGLIAFDRPLKKYSVAVLLGFGVFMILVGTLMLRDVFTTSPASVNSFNTGLNTNGSQEMFSMANIATMVGGMVFFFAIMGIFAYTGYFGKRL